MDVEEGVPVGPHPDCAREAVEYNPKIAAAASKERARAVSFMGWRFLSEEDWTGDNSGSG
jgi:hypothetical protein